MAPLSHLLLLSLLSGALANSRFVTRPDLSPPRLNITHPATEDVDDGFIFVGPYSGFVKGGGFDGPEQPAGYIFRDNGDLVWSSLGYLSGWVGNLQVRTYDGKQVITGFQGSLDSFHGHGFGHPTILDDTYESIRDVHGGNHKVISIHEFNVLPSDSALVEIYQPVEMDLSEYSNDPEAKWIVDAIFQEIDLKSGNLIFEWSSLDHCSPAESNVTLSSGHAGDGHNSTGAWDYFHINSVDKDDDGNYLISARHTSTLYKIDGRTGEILWQLGGQKSTFAFDDDVFFGFQHDARFVKRSESTGDREYVSLFDNAARANGHRGGGVEIVHSMSRAKIIHLDKAAGVASVEVSLSAPGDLLAPSQGNVQTLPNSNLFVNWGQAGALTEFRESDGQVVFHAHLDSDDIGQGVQSYRGFRFPWKGYPREVPAIAWRGDSSGGERRNTVYVSWNGDTETRIWRFYGLKTEACQSSWFCRPRLLGEVERTSFETSLELVGDLSQLPLVYAESVDNSGKVLGKTEAIELTRDGTTSSRIHPSKLATSIGATDENQRTFELI